MNTTEATISELPLAQLHESPFNPRKTFNQIEELAANITAEGRIHSPLLVRPRLPNPLRPDVQDGWEVVFGHRRLRAAQAAGLATVPCMVRAMTDAEARRAQIAENLARADVHPIEEGEGFQLMLDQDGITAEALAEQVGKSLSYVYARIKLLQACPEIRQACLAGEIGSEVALLIARLRTDKLQQKALAAIRNDTSSSAKLDDGGKRSFRHIRDLLAEKFTLALKGAIFNPEDATLLPDAGVCSACPKRTANAPEYADLAANGREGEYSGYTRHGGPDICTDPDCFDAKKQAHLQRAAAELAAKGSIVITGNKARAAVSATGEVKGDYIALADVKRALKGASAKVKPADLPVVAIQNPRDGKVVQAVKRFDLVAKGLLKPEQANKAGKAEAQQQHQREQWERERKAKAEKAAENTKRHLALLQQVRQASAGRERTVFELRLVAAAALAGVPWASRHLLCELHGVKNPDQLKKLVDTLGAASLTQLLLDCILVDHVIVEAYDPDTKPGPLLALAEHYGIDAKAVMAAAVQPPPPAEGTPTPSTAGAGAKKAAGKASAKLLAKGVRYHNPATGDTWTGRGLQPRWVKDQLGAGAKLADFEVQKVKDGAGSAGEQPAKAAVATEDLAEAEA